MRKLFTRTIVVGVYSAVLLMAMSTFTPSCEAGGWAKSNKGKFVQAVDTVRDETLEMKKENGSQIPDGLTEQVIYRAYVVIRQFIAKANPDLSDVMVEFISQCILNSCAKRNVDPLVMTALFYHESTFRPNACSEQGAYGLGQLMPDTAVSLGVTDRGDIAQNIDGSTEYLLEQSIRFGSASKALAAYNAGPLKVEKYGGIPPYAETQQYVRNISATYNWLRQQYDQVQI